MHMIVTVKSEINVTQHSFNDAHWCQSTGMDTWLTLNSDTHTFLE